MCVCAGRVCVCVCVVCVCLCVCAAGEGVSVCVCVKERGKKIMSKGVRKKQERSSFIGA